MKNMTLKEIAVACGGIYYGDDESYYKEVSSVVIDSRKVEKDCLFIAIRGARVDGHMFIPQTIRDGAYAPSIATRTALMVCILFSASSNTTDWLDSNTSSVTSSSDTPKRSPISLPILVFKSWKDGRQ